MNPGLALGGLALASYLAGSIPFGLLIARGIRGIDLRASGSGNIGATNTARTLGMKWGALCLALDFLKGLLPTFLFWQLVTWPEGWPPTAKVVCATAAIIGHIAPVWLGFRGGKGVATAAGATLILAPIAWLAAVAAFAIAFAAGRIVSLATLLAACVFAITVFAVHRDIGDRAQWALFAFALAIPALIVARHRSNIIRLCRGEEKPLSAKPGSTEAKSTGPGKL